VSAWGYYSYYSYFLGSKVAILINDSIVDYGERGDWVFDFECSTIVSKHGRTIGTNLDGRCPEQPCSHQRRWILLHSSSSSSTIFLVVIIILTDPCPDRLVIGCHLGGGTITGRSVFATVGTLGRID